MKIVTKIASDCSAGLDCPTLYSTDDGRMAVQGYTVTPTTVRITAALVAEAMAHGYDLSWSETDGYLVRGETVTAEAGVKFPDGEHAVIPTRTLQEALP